MSETIALHFTYRMSFETWVKKGLDIRERKFYAALRREGYDVIFTTYDARSRVGVTTEGIHYYGLSRPNRKARLPLVDYVFELWALRNLVAAQNVKLLKTNQLTGAFHAIPLKLLTGNRVIVRCGYEWMDSKLRRERSALKRVAMFPFLWIIEFIIYLLADRVVISNYAQQRFIANWFPLFSEKVSVIRNYIDTDFYSPGLGERNRSVLFVGRLVKQKNVDVLIRACASIDTELIIVGDGPEGEYLVALANKLGAKAKFLGRRSPLEVRSLMQSCSVFVLASSYEGSPKALLEAMACGMIVVVTRVVGSEELVQDGVTGHLCAPTESALQNTIRHALTGAGAIRKAAREFVDKNCSFDAVLGMELKLIRAMFG